MLTIDEKLKKLGKFIAKTSRENKEASREHKERIAYYDKMLEDSKLDRAESERARAESEWARAQAKAESDRIWAEFREYVKKTDSRLKIQEDHWGDFIEAFIEHQAVELFRAIGIDVTRTGYEKGCKNGENFEFDIVLKNGKEVIFVEAKTTLQVKHVDHFVKKLKKIKEWMPEYKDFTIYGAVAFMQEHSSAGVMAANRGLFTIVATAKSSTITNVTGFKPAAF